MNLSIRHWLEEHHINLAQLSPSEAGIAGVAFTIAQDMELKSLTVFDISVLAEVLSLPMHLARTQMQQLSQLTGGLLQQLSRKKPLKRNEGTWLAFQIAYINALRQLLEQEEVLRKSWVNRARVPVAESQSEVLLNHPQLTELLNTLTIANLSDTQAEQALSQKTDSLLVQQINNTARAWLVANGAEEIEARLLIQRLSHGLPGHLLEAIALHYLSLPQLQKFVRLGNIADWIDILPDSDDYELLESPPVAPVNPPAIDLHRERYRASFTVQLSEPLFEECFALEDLYVPPKGVKLEDGDVPQSSMAIDLMDWACAQLKDLESVAVIEAPPGQGKTSFCQMWAAQVAREFYPQWMPISIKLREAKLGYTLEQTLASVLPQANFTCTDGWLSPMHPPCILILDGLDELPRSPLAEDHLWLLFDQLVRFQSEYTGTAGKPRHKIVLTCRTGTISSAGVDTFRETSLQTPLLAHLKRIGIQPMSQEELKHWFRNWSKLQTKTIAQEYFNFLKQAGLFRSEPPYQELATMVHQPLMLYVLGILHRDGLLDEEILSTETNQLRFEIYDRLVTWLLGEPTAGLSTPKSIDLLVRPGLAHARRSQEAIANILEDKRPKQVRHQMQVTALTMLQSGRLSAPKHTLEAHLGKQALPAFYFRPVTGNGLDIDSTKPTDLLEFSHPTLGEYLCAEQIARELKSLAQMVSNSYGQRSFAIDSPNSVAQHLYNLLGYGLLPMDMEQLIVDRLWREEVRDAVSFRFRTLFGRLHRFYQSYCRGRWIDEGMAHQTRNRLRELDNPLNALQIDAAVGLNVFLLLCACCRAAGIPFWPCGNPHLSRQIQETNEQKSPPVLPNVLSAEQPMEFNPSQLLVLAGRTAVLYPKVFWQRVRHSLNAVILQGAYLNRAMLAGGNLQNADLQAALLVEASLASANLAGANLSWANLMNANLLGANLSDSNFEGANLMGADLRGCDLESANLTNACLYQAQMDSKAMMIARTQGAFFSWEQFQAYRGAIASQTLKQQASHIEQDDTSVLPIDIAEDEPKPVYPGVVSNVSLSSDLSDSEVDVDTVVIDSNANDEANIDTVHLDERPNLEMRD